MKLSPGAHKTLPPPKGRWAEWLMTQRVIGCSPEDQLRALEMLGATPKELAELVMDIYLPSYPRFRGLSEGFMKSRDLSPRDTRMNLWVLQTLEEGWRVLEVFGTDPFELLSWTLGQSHPSMWKEELARLRAPSTLMDVLRPDGLEFHPQQPPLDLRWLPRVAGSLKILGRIPRVLLPATMACRSEVLLREAGGLTELKEWEASNLCVEGCPDLVTIHLQPATPMHVQACPSLKAIHGPLPPSLVIEDCPELELLDVIFPRSGPPTPSLTVRRCPKLRAIGRFSPHTMECRDLVLEDCPSLKNFWPKLAIRRDRRIEECPTLEILP